MTRYVVLDVSSNNGQRVDVAGIRRQHPELAGGFVKATEGGSYVNPYFAQQYDAFRAAGLPVGAYAFAHPKVSGTYDVDLFLRTIGSRELRLGTAWDCEISDGLEPGTVLARFLEDISALSHDPRKDLLYTGRWFWDPNTRGSVAAHVERIPLWLSWYKPLLTPDAFPTPWTSCRFWQFTDNYFGTGIDASVWTGTDAEWNTWLGVNPPPPPPPPIEGFHRYQGFLTIKRGGTDGAPGRPGVLADSTKPVTSLQNALNVVDRHESTADPAYLRPDGIFGLATDQAVRALQRGFHRTVDGIVGVDTWTLLAFLLTNLHR